MTSLTTVVTQLKQERNRLASQLRRVEAAINSLGGLLLRRGKSMAPRRRRRMSRASRARIAAAQRARWAKWKAGKKR